MSRRLDIADTFPWHFSGAAAALDGPYAIGVVTSLKLGSVICSIGYDGPDMEENITKVDVAGKYIIEQLNELHRGGRVERRND